MTREVQRLRLVLDTNVLVAAARSRTGAANELFRAMDRDEFQAVASVAILFEYEAVLSRPAQLQMAGLTLQGVAELLDALADRMERAETHVSWRPQLTDEADEMVLEAAVNGRADAIVTFNTRHLAPAKRFGVDVWTPSDAMKGIRRGSR